MKTPTLSGGLAQPEAGLATRLTMVLLSLMISGCGIITERGIYEGIRTQQKVRSSTGANSPSTPAANTNLPSYDQYEKEREKLRQPAN